MGKIKIVTDSTSDLTKEQAEALGVSIIPLKIILEGKSYQDNVDFTHEAYIEKMVSLKELPTSSQPAVGEMVELFRNLKEDEDTEILAIMISGELSGTYQAAQVAAEMAEANVTVFDSKNVAYGLQMQVLEAVKMANEGKTMAEIIERLTFIRANVKLYFTLNQLDNLVKGGRLSKTKATISSLLNIKPILAIEQGTIQPVDKVRSFGQAAKYCLNKFKEDSADKTVTYLGTIHVAAKENGEQLRASISELVPNREIPLMHASQVLTTHAGPGVIGIIYLVE